MRCYRAKVERAWLAFWEFIVVAIAGFGWRAGALDDGTIKRDRSDGGGQESGGRGKLDAPGDMDKTIGLILEGREVLDKRESSSKREAPARPPSLMDLDT